MRVATQIVLGDKERAMLTKLAHLQTSSVRLAQRARIVLLAAEGRENIEIARLLRIGRVQAGRWRDRYREGGLAAIAHDRPRGGRKPTVDANAIVRLTTQTLPAHATHWSARTMARAVGVSERSVRRVWRAHGLKPHRLETFKVSRDPRFVEKLTDVVGLYLNPPEHALVLCCDEKCQVQALDAPSRGCP
jgi:transposase